MHAENAQNEWQKTEHTHIHSHRTRWVTAKSLFFLPSFPFNDRNKTCQRCAHYISLIISFNVYSHVLMHANRFSLNTAKCLSFSLARRSYVTIQINKSYVRQVFIAKANEMVHSKQRCCNPSQHERQFCRLYGAAAIFRALCHRIIHMLGIRALAFGFMSFSTV